jgi:D-threo-aldose 1-dehydrogenase
MDALRGDGLAYLARQKAQGRIGAIGLGVNETAICLEIMQDTPLDVILLAGRLTLLDRAAAAELVPRCAALGTSLVLGGVFNSGILATGPVPGATFDYAAASADVRAAVTRLQQQAESLGMSLPQAALLFARTHPAAASVLIGTASATLLTRNLAMARASVPAAFGQVFDVPARPVQG